MSASSRDPPLITTRSGTSRARPGGMAAAPQKGSELVCFASASPVEGKVDHVRLRDQHQAAGNVARGEDVRCGGPKIGVDAHVTPRVGLDALRLTAPDESFPAEVAVRGGRAGPRAAAAADHRRADVASSRVADSCWITSGRMTPDHREVADRELLGAVQPPGDRGPALRRRGVQQAGEQGLCLQQDHGRVGAGLDEIV